MSKVLVEESSLQNIANAIRTMSNKTDKYMPSEMATAINNIQTLKGGGYKVNITQSEHQTITVSQSSFDNQTTGFTIDDYPSINVSLKADPGYKAGSLNLTNFTFSNDVREVDIFATEATYYPNITYNGNMNVIKSGSSFNITSASSYDSGNHHNEAFDLELLDLEDTQIYELRIAYKDNFYSLDPGTEYKITALKIGDTSLSSDDLADGNPTLSTVSARINADLSKDWVKSVYKQCTGKELEISYVDGVSPIDIDSFIQDGTPSDAKDAYLGEQIANTLSTVFVEDAPASTSELLSGIDTELGGIAFGAFIILSDDEQKKFINDMTTFMTTFKKTNPTGFRTGNLVQGYYYKLQKIMQKYGDDDTALNILKEYNPATNTAPHGLSGNGFATLRFTDPNPDLFQLIYQIDPSDKYGFLASLPGGNAYVLWLFYARYVVAEVIMAQSNNKFAGFLPYFKPDTPTISTIPVSITFTNIASQK